MPGFISTTFESNLYANLPYFSNGIASLNSQPLCSPGNILDLKYRPSFECPWGGVPCPGAFRDAANVEAVGLGHALFSV